MTEPDWIGTIAEGLPHPGVRRAVPDSQDRYDQVSAHLAEQLDAYQVSHLRTEGGFHLHIGVPLRTVSAGSLLDAELESSTGGSTPVAWPPTTNPIDLPPSAGTLAVIAAYGFVVTGIQIRPTSSLSIAQTGGRTLPGDQSPIDVPTPGIVVVLAVHDCTTDAFRSQIRHDRRVPSP